MAKATYDLSSSQLQVVLHHCGKVKDLKLLVVSTVESTHLVCYRRSSTIQNPFPREWCAALSGQTSHHN